MKRKSCFFGDLTHTKLYQKQSIGRKQWDVRKLILHAFTPQSHAFAFSAMPCNVFWSQICQNDSHQIRNPISIGLISQTDWFKKPRLWRMAKNTVTSYSIAWSKTLPRPQGRICCAALDRFWKSHVPKFLFTYLQAVAVITLMRSRSFFNRGWAYCLSEFLPSVLKRLRVKVPCCTFASYTAIWVNVSSEHFLPRALAA